jgi:hypothetical protein
MESAGADSEFGAAKTLYLCSGTNTPLNPWATILIAKKWEVPGCLLAGKYTDFWVM